ncbi:uncharacterized protein JCM10292_006385 [Rhodotorula paludigena]|uniref:uncharacterized protein n=1 Tax=Rhodotorula paludigena TaxID=86838 RepID=UPI00316F7B64
MSDPVARDMNVPSSPVSERPRQRRFASSFSKHSNPDHLEDKLATGPSTPGEHSLLPPPAVAFVPPGTTNKLKVRWQKLKRRIGNGSAPSESLGDPTATTESDTGSTFAGGRRAGVLGGAGKDGEKGDEEDLGVDEVVVEQTNDYDCWKRTTIPSASASHRGNTGTGTSPGTGQIGTMPSDGSSFRQTAYEANGPVDAAIGFVRYRVWPIMSRFFAPSYHDPSVEDAYQKECWYNGKGSHIFGAMYFTINWALTVALIPKPWSAWNKASLWAIWPVFIVPLIALAAFDVPRRHTWLWQGLVFCAIVFPAIHNPVDQYMCHFYRSNPNCGGKDFMATFYYVTALPTVALFAMGQKRLFAVIFDVIWLVIVAVLILPDRPAYVRNVVNILLFQGFILFLHYLREMADRRMYTMRAELKISFKAKQRAQQNEKRQMDAKRRFSSYIFHEVRVPLNTALLAVQNLKGLNVFNKDSENAIEYSALEGSLQMMSQVLNDVLDFSRMERGGFSSVSRPFSLHNVMRSIFVPLRLDAAARGLTLDTTLDVRIDELAVQASRGGQPLPPNMAVREGDGVVMGDEMRLRQIIGNLVSNACKFSPAGGRITIKTELIYPLESYDTPQNLPSSAELAGLEDGDDEKHGQDRERAKSHASAKTDDTLAPGETTATRLTPNRLQQHEAKTSPQTPQMLVVRFEVQDTGVGIRSSDMAESRLFSPYVQTAVGREQGGKGTGLGLSLVRQIVMLSGGRLGVRSKVGEGSTFWIEMPYALSTFPSAPPTSPRAKSGGFADVGAGRGSSLSGLGQRKDPKGDSTAVTPATDSSGASDYRFVGSLRKRSSDPTLDSIDESSLASPRPRDSSVTTQLSIPTSRFSPPASPAIPNVTTPNLFVHTPTPPNVATPHLFMSGATSATSPAIFSPHFSLGGPIRPENRSHVSSASAPADVTLSPAEASSPVVSPAPLPPIAQPLAPGPATAAAVAASTSGKLEFPDGPLKVLVVDDDTLTRRLMSRMMLRLGCEVETAENGKIALDMILAPPPPGQASADGAEESSGSGTPEEIDAAERGVAIARKKPKKVGLPGPPAESVGIDAFQHYHIVFLDNQMPVCSGVQVVTKLRQLGRDDLVVGVTANALLSDQEQYLESGASFILTKPVLEVDLRKYLLIADKRRVERKNPALRAARQAMVNASGPHFPPLNAVIGPERDDDDDDDVVVV